MKNWLSTCVSLLLAGQLNGQILNAEEQKAIAAYATPGPMQDRLTRHFGEWDEKVYLWNAPDAPTDSMHMVVDYEMILDKRFLRIAHSGSLGGKPWEAIALTGYDNVRQVYTDTWIDYSGTGIIYSEGKWNDAEKSIEFKGEMTDPITRKKAPYRKVWSFPDPMHQTIEVFHRYKGKEFRAMLLKLERF